MGSVDGGSHADRASGRGLLSHRAALPGGRSHGRSREGMSSIERLALRCLLPGFIGPVAPDWVKRSAEAGLGGVVLYGRNVAGPRQLANLTADLHAEHPRLLIAIDEEGGDVTRLEAETGSSYPGHLALGSGGAPRLTHAGGA